MNLINDIYRCLNFQKNLFFEKKCFNVINNNNLKAEKKVQVFLIGITHGCLIFITVIKHNIDLHLNLPRFSKTIIA